MTKQYFQELANYNRWANSIVCNWLTQISDAQWTREMVSSFNSIRETVLHIISAENAWLQRFKKIPVTWLQSTFKGSKDEHIDLWKKTSEGFQSYVDTFDENELTTKLDYRRLNGEEYSTPYYQLFAHVVNHGSYHRGQLVTMLRQAGFTNVSSTDLLQIYRHEPGIDQKA